MAIDPLISSCQLILNQVRKSNLHFSVQETPFSIYMTVRKSFVKTRSVPEINLLDNESEHLQSKLTLLQIEYGKLNENFRESLDQNESKTYNIAKLEEKIGDLHTELNKKDDLLNSAETKTLDSIRALQVKHEKICAENKNLKHENEDLKKEINSTNVALKGARKEVKENSHRLGKKMEALEDEVKTLLDFKITKEAEEKDLKAKMKKAEKKMKLVREREAVVEIEKVKLRKEFENNNNIVKTEESKDTMDQHQSDKKVSEIFRNFDCSNCPQSFQNLEVLLDHFKANHKENSDTLSLEPQPDFTCAFCRRDFEALAQLIDHIRTLHRLPTTAETRAFLQEFQKITTQTIAEAIATIESDPNMSEI